MVLFGDSHPDVPDNAWLQEYRAIIDTYGREEEQRQWRTPGWVPHMAVLLDSPFSELEEISVIERRDVSAGILIERALSMSSTSRALLGERAEDLVRDLTALLARLAPAGQLVEVVATNALMARRPGL